MSTKIEISKMLTLAMAPITPTTTMGLLDDAEADSPVMSAYSKNGFGHFVYVPDLCEIENIDIPKDLKQCLIFAKNQNCQWIMFDSDAIGIDELPIYEW